MDLNYIDENSEGMGESADFTLLAMTLFVSFSAVGYGLFYLKDQLRVLEQTKQNIDTGNETECSFYQAWSGAFADGENSLIITLVKKKFCSKRENDTWIDWDGSEDASVVSRNFYLGNLNPSFDWKIEPRDNDVKVSVSETMIDGWDSIIQMKLMGFVTSSYDSSEKLNSYLQKLIVENKIEWQKTILDIREYQEIFT